LNDARPQHPATRIAFLIAAATAVAVLSLSATPEEALAPLGDFAHHQDIGAPKLAGSATWNAASQEYRLTAAGVNLWGKRDEFHYAWRRITGDFILQVRVEFVGQGVDPHRKAGFLVRGSLDEDSPYADAVVHGDGLTSLQSRREKAGLTEQIVSGITDADFLHQLTLLSDLQDVIRLPNQKVVTGHVQRTQVVARRLLEEQPT